MNANYQRQIGKLTDSLMLYDVAAQTLEEELLHHKMPEKERVLKLRRLEKCLRTLCVESSLPKEFRMVLLSGTWDEYIIRLCDVAKELDSYK